jgi:hypothetical protein
MPPRLASLCWMLLNDYGRGWLHGCLPSGVSEGKDTEDDVFIDNFFADVGLRQTQRHPLQPSLLQVVQREEPRVDQAVARRRIELLFL